jgi:hypothetical protein
LPGFLSHAFLARQRRRRPAASRPPALWADRTFPGPRPSTRSAAVRECRTCQSGRRPDARISSAMAASSRFSRAVRAGRTCFAFELRFFAFWCVTVRRAALKSSAMPNLRKSSLVENLTARFGRVRELAGSRSLFAVGDDTARIYIRYSKVHDTACLLRPAQRRFAPA